MDNNISLVKFDTRMNCAVCNSALIDEFFEIDKYPFCQQPLRANRRVSVPWHPLCIVGCRHCGLVQHGYTYDNNALHLLYSQQGIYNDNKFSTYGAVTPCADYLIPMILKYVPDHYNDEFKVLEIGCGRAERVKILRDKNICIYGIDPALPEELISDRIIRATFEGNPFSAMFDIIYHGDVMEHMPNPLPFLRNVYSALKDGGIHIIQVPNERLLFAKTGFGNFNNAHQLYFTPDQLKGLLECVGYSVIELNEIDYKIVLVAKKVKDCSPNYIFHKIDTIPEYFDKYKIQFHTIRRRLFDMTDYFSGKSVALYGAGTNAYAFLNFRVINNDQVKYVIDGNRTIKGSYLFGLDVPIDNDIGLLSMVDLVIITAQNAQDSILNTIKGYPFQRPLNVLTLYPEPDLHLI